MGAVADPLSRELVVRTAREQLERDGVEQLSLRAVARELGVTAPALYLYVQDRDDLLAAVATEHFERLVERFDAVDEADPLQRIRALCHAYVDHARESPTLFALMFRYPPRPVPEVDAFPPAERAFAVAAAATADAVESGALRVPDATEAGVVMWCAVHGVAEVVLSGFAGDDAATRLLDQVVDTVLAGQITPLGTTPLGTAVVSTPAVRR